MKLEWNEDKNKLLIKTRGLSFEMVEQAVLEGKLIKVDDNKNIKYPHQYILLVELNNYIHCVPAVKKLNGYFLKTIYACRKMDKLYKEGKL